MSGLILYGRIVDVRGVRYVAPEESMSAKPMRLMLILYTHRASRSTSCSNCMI
jgi:hypothetical protein